MFSSVSTVSALLGNLEAAESSYRRVAAEIEAVAPDDLPTINFDVISGASIILGVCGRGMGFRDRNARLPEFDIKNVDNLKDYAVAAWYVYITNLPEPEPVEADALIAEVGTLRSKFLMWSVPLVGEGVFDQGAVDKIKEGTGFKDAASDVVAFVGLYRSKWDQCTNKCGISEADLERAALVAPRVFSIVSQREQRQTTPTGEGFTRVRRAWALPERAYDQCRRAIAYLRHTEGDMEEIAPNFRRNAGNTKSRPTATTPVVAAPSAPSAPTVPTAPVGGNAIGGGDNPFVATR